MVVHHFSLAILHELFLWRTWISSWLHHCETPPPLIVLLFKHRHPALILRLRVFLFHGNLIVVFFSWFLCLINRLLLNLLSDLLLLPFLRPLLQPLVPITALENRIRGHLVRVRIRRLLLVDTNRVIRIEHLLRRLLAGSMLKLVDERLNSVIDG